MTLQLMLVLAYWQGASSGHGSARFVIEYRCRRRVICIWAGIYKARNQCWLSVTYNWFTGLY